MKKTLLALLPILLVGCAQELRDAVPDTSQDSELELFATYEGNDLTRTVVNEDGLTFSFKSTDDQLGVFLNYNNMLVAENVQFEADGAVDGWVNFKKIGESRFNLDLGAATTVYAYYPYTETPGTLMGRGGDSATKASIAGWDGLWTFNLPYTQKFATHNSVSELVDYYAVVAKPVECEKDPRTNQYSAKLGFSGAFALMRLKCKNETNRTLTVNSVEVNMNYPMTGYLQVDLTQDPSLSNSSYATIPLTGEGDTFQGVKAEFQTPAVIAVNEEVTAYMVVNAGSYTSLSFTMHTTEGDFTKSATASGSVTRTKRKQFAISFTDDDQVPVARIGETTYTSLPDAIEAAQAGQTIEILCDIVAKDADVHTENLDNADHVYRITKNINIDGGNHTVFGQFSDQCVGKAHGVYMFMTEGATVGFSNLKIAAAEGNAGTIKSGINAIYGSTVTITDCDIRTSDQHGSNANWNISAVIVNASDVTINGGTYLGGKMNGTTPDYQGVNVGGANAELTFSAGTTNGIKIESATANVAISGGTHTDGGVFLDGADGATVLTTGGLYANDVTAFCAHGYMARLQSGGTMYEIVPIPPVAKIGDTTYVTLADAVAAVPATGVETTITMLADEVITYDTATAITIPSTKNIVLDLDGHKITGATSLESTSQLFLNQGTLTITGGTIEQGASPAWVYEGGDNYAGSYASNMFRNEGTLNITDGTFNVVTNGSAAYIVDNYNAATLNISGGAFNAKNTAIRLFYGSCKVTVSGGTITAGGYDIIQFVNASSTSEINITGGEFVTEASDSFNVYGWAENAAQSASLKISGGSFNAWVGSSGSYATTNVEISGGQFHGVYSYASGSKFVTGGVFAVSPATFVAEGYRVVENTDPSTSANYPYTIGVDTRVARIGQTKYDTLAEAAAAAVSGDTIELLTDVENQEAINLPAGVTLDGGNHTISGNSCIYIANAGGAVKNVNFLNIHNTAGQLSAIYANALSGTASVTGCSFTDCDWDAVQIVPVAGAEVVVTNNTFTDAADDSIKQQRFIHVQSAVNVDFSATITGNVMNGDTAQGNLEVYYFADPAKIALDHNYIATSELTDVCILDGQASNKCEMILPLYASADKSALASFDIVDKFQYSQTFYASWPSAFAPKGNAVHNLLVLRDVTLSRRSFGAALSRGFTANVDLNGHTVTSNNTSSSFPLFVIHQNSTGTVVSFDNGKIVSTTDPFAVFQVKNAATLNLGSNLTIESNVSAAFVSNGATVNSAANITVANDFAIAGNGSDAVGTTVNITGGNLKSTAGIGIYQPQKGQLNISGGTIEGLVGVYVKSGALSVTGGTIKGTGPEAAYVFNANGCQETGDALVVDCCDYPGGNPTASITAGTFLSTNAKAVGSYAYGSGSPLAGFITGGTFSNDVIALCAAGYMTDPIGAGLYQVVAGSNTGVSGTTSSFGGWE